MNQVFRKIISFFLLAVFLTATTPHDLFHLLADHHDTVDSNSPVTAVSNRHVHCEALQLSLPSFSEAKLLTVDVIIFDLAPLFSRIYSPLLPNHEVALSGRSPPIIG